MELENEKGFEIQLIEVRVSGSGVVEDNITSKMISTLKTNSTKIF